MVAISKKELLVLNGGLSQESVILAKVATAKRQSVKNNKSLAVYLEGVHKLISQYKHNYTPFLGNIKEAGLQDVFGDLGKYPIIKGLKCSATGLVVPTALKRGDRKGNLLIGIEPEDMLTKDRKDLNVRVAEMEINLVSILNHRYAKDGEDLVARYTAIWNDHTSGTKLADLAKLHNLSKSRLTFILKFIKFNGLEKLVNFTKPDHTMINLAVAREIRRLRSLGHGYTDITIRVGLTSIHNVMRICSFPEDTLEDSIRYYYEESKHALKNPTTQAANHKKLVEEVIALRKELAELKAEKKGFFTKLFGR